jgi:uncharacterized protein YjdB
VTTPVVSSITVSPDGLTLAEGIKQQYTATAIYSDGSSQDLAGGVTWTSSDNGVASMDNHGVATTLGPGTVTVTATAGNLTDTATLTVVAANLVSIAVTPANASIAFGTDQQFVATGIFNDGSTQQLSSVVAWSSSNANVVSINASGLATSTGPGSATITAASGSVSGTANIIVDTATLVSITVTATNASMAIGTTRQFTATGKFSDNTSQDITLSVLWSSSNPAQATMSSQGVVTSLAAGTPTITATAGAVSGSTGLTISSVRLQSIAVTPTSPRIQQHTLIKFTAVGTFTDGSTTSSLSGLSWKSSKPQFASVRSTGVANGKKLGSATITASASGISGQTTLTVSNATLSSVAITPANPSVAQGSTQQFTATGTFTDATTQDITLNTHWSSSSASVATIANGPNGAGLASTTAPGTTVIGANSGGTTSSTTMTVD